MLDFVILILIAILFSLHEVSVRKGVSELDLMIGNLISISTTTAIFLPVLVLRFHPNAEFVALMVVAGILQFFVARLCFYASIERVGANVASALSATRIYFAELFGAVMGEEITLKLIVASTLVFVGIVLLSNPKDCKDPIGVALGLATAVFAVLSSVVVKIGLQCYDDPIFGSAIGYLSSFVLFLLLIPKSTTTSIDLSKAKYFVLGGIFVGMGHLLRYYELGKLPISVVEPVISIYPLFTILLSFVFIRRMEVFSVRVILGSISIVVGVYECGDY